MMRTLTRKSSIVLLSIAAAFAGEKERPAFKPGPASSFATRQTISGVTVAAVALRSDAEAEPAFGKVNPYKYGVLPVLVVIQNDSKQTIALDGLKVSFVLPDHDRVEATPAADVKYISGPSAPNVHAGPVPQLPTHVSRSKSPLGEWQIEGRAFAAHMLAPKDSASGFFYFRATWQSGSTLYLTGLREPASGKELFYFEVPLD
ncbi:MAG: hypothetical protein ABSH46_20150 [Bryobacteraceae bacterium]|jgi:hypothetical protein